MLFLSEGEGCAKSQSQNQNQSQRWERVSKERVDFSDH
jgi:hypothetical protein